MLLGMGVIMTYGFYKLGVGIREKKYVQSQSAASNAGQGAKPGARSSSNPVDLEREMNQWFNCVAGLELG
jgi:hypothetical protein